MILNIKKFGNSRHVIIPKEGFEDIEKVEVIPIKLKERIELCEDAIKAFSMIQDERAREVKALGDKIKAIDMWLKDNASGKY
jgi:antitoxin component of MazEF toxin-antitoxin module